jgi:hypothetical protein
MKRHLRIALAMMIYGLGSFVTLCNGSPRAVGQTRPAQPSAEKKAPKKQPPINPTDVGGPRGMGTILRGTVVDRAGAELPRASVNVISPANPQGHWNSTTDAAGRFQIDDLPVGLYTVEVSRPGFQTGRYIGLKLDSLLCSVRVPLSPGPADRVVTTHFVELRGRVVEGNGDSVPGAQVEVTGPAFARSLTVLTDAEGEFQVPNFQTGSYSVRVTAAGFATYANSKLEVTAEDEAKPVTLRFTLKKAN